MIEKNIKGIIFDLDGTLANTIGDLCTAINSMLKKLGFDEKSEEEMLTHINQGVYDFVAGCLPDNPYGKEKNDEFIKHAVSVYSEFYTSNYCEKTYPYTGLIELCKDLKGHNYSLAVLSNKQDKLTKLIVEKLYGNDIFSIVLGKTEQFPHKPAPSAALYIAEQMGVQPSECAFVGDSNVDMDTADNSGMYAVGVTWGYRSEDILVAHGAKKIIHNADEMRNLFIY